MMRNNNGKVFFILSFLLIIWLISSISANIFMISSGNSISQNNNVVLLKVDNFISTRDDYNVLSSTKFVKDLEYYSSLDNVKAIIIEINSPGGSPVASKEIVDAIKEVNKTVVSYIRDLGASGAYWIASATDKIYSNELSIVGSIGVSGSFLGFSGFLEEYNISYNRIVAGEYKDLGTPLRDMTNNEKEMLERQVNLMYEIFVRDVAKNRDMDYEILKNYSEGKIFLGIEAKRNGLVDDIGGLKETIKYLEKKLEVDVNLFEIETKKTFMSFFSNLNFLNSFDSLLIKI